MNNKSKPSIQNKLTVYKEILKAVWIHGFEWMGMQQIIQNKNIPNLSTKNSQYGNQCPLVRLKSNIAQRPETSVCTRRNHTSCQQIQTKHHWPEQPTNNWTVSPIKRRKKATKNMARRPSWVVPETSMDGTWLKTFIIVLFTNYCKNLSTL
jgi:hypothetical protein